MSFEKAKKTLAKTTPGVEMLKDSYKIILHFESLLLDILSKPRLLSRSVDGAKADVDRLYGMGAISEETYNALLTSLENIKTAGGTEESVMSAHYKMVDAAEEIARWARAPKAVGVGRTVTE